MEDCPFCNRAMFEERIITETDEFFAIATLGQITDGGYVLIFPKRHVRCLNALSSEEMMRFVHLLSAVKRAVDSAYYVFPSMFEHGIVGQTVEHAHMHLVPFPRNIRSLVEDDFPETRYESFDLFRDGIPFQVSEKLQPYLLWHSPRPFSMTNIWWNPKNVPAQYFRTRIAAVLRRPKRANWRTMDPKLDKRLWSETVLRLKKYF